MVDLGAAGTARSRLDEVQIGKAEPIERLDDMGIERHRIGFAAAIGHTVGRQPDADAISTPHFDRGFGISISSRARFSIDPPYRSVRKFAARLQELLEQIAVGAMDFDAVEPGLQGIAGGLSKRLDDSLDFAGLERARRFIGHYLAVGGHRHHSVAHDRHRRWRDRQRATRLERGMRNRRHARAGERSRRLLA